jgi:hypothetical protein
MRSVFGAIVLVAMMTVLGGCLEGLGWDKAAAEPEEKPAVRAKESEPESPAQAKEPLWGDWFGKKDVEATIAEIDAVSKLKSDSAMYGGFKAIARREDLSIAAQVRLGRLAAEKLYSPADKEEVLLLLIKNPSFSHEGKMEILTRIDKLPEENKIKVLGAINNRVIEAD